MSVGERRRFHDVKQSRSRTPNNHHYQPALLAKKLSELETLGTLATATLKLGKLSHCKKACPDFSAAHERAQWASWHGDSHRAERRGEFHGSMLSIHIGRSTSTTVARLFWANHASAIQGRPSLPGQLRIALGVRHTRWVGVIPSMSAWLRATRLAWATAGCVRCASLRVSLVALYPIAFRPSVAAPCHGRPSGKCPQSLKVSCRDRAHPIASCDSATLSSAPFVGRPSRSIHSTIWLAWAIKRNFDAGKPPCHALPPHLGQHSQ